MFRRFFSGELPCHEPSCGVWQCTKQEGHTSLHLAAITSLLPKLMAQVLEAHPPACLVLDLSAKMAFDHLSDDLRVAVLTLIIEAEATSTATSQILLQFCAARVGLLRYCQDLVDRGASPDAGSANDTRTPREIGRGSDDPAMREYFRTVGLLLGRYRLVLGPAGDDRIVVRLSC